MNEAETIQILLYCLIGVVGSFGVAVITMLLSINKSVSDMAKDHGERITRLETRAEFFIN